MVDLAKCPDVSVKISGLMMRFAAIDLSDRETVLFSGATKRVYRLQW